jgi:hypothetical protein
MGAPKTPKKTTQVNEVKLSPEQQKVFNLALPSITQAASQTPQVYGGQTVAGFNPAEHLGQAQVLDTAGGSMMDLAGAGSGANQFLLNPAMLSMDSNPYLQGYGESIAGGMTTNLMENILPKLRSGARMAGGAYSGNNSRQGLAEAGAVTGTQGAIGDALQKLAYDAYSRGLTGMEKGLALNPQTMASQMMPGQAASAVGGQMRQMDQAMLDDAAQRFYMEQNLPFLKAQDLMGLISGMPGGSGVSTVTGAQPRSSPLMGGLGGAASGAMLGSMVMPGIGTAVGGGLGALLGILG